MKKFASIPTVKKIDPDKRTIEHVISTGTEDRDGDIIDPKGWILDEYLRNNVVLFAHRHDVPPIGRAIKLKASAEGLEALTQFPRPGVFPLADTVFQLNVEGFLRSWSVGFDPIKFNMREDGGIAFEEQKLLEYSSVPVPANPEAVNLAVQKGIMTDKMLELFEWNKGGLVEGFGVGPHLTPLCSEHELSPKLRADIAKLLADENQDIDIDAEKLQSWFEEGNIALQISGAHHARILRPGKTIPA